MNGFITAGVRFLKDDGGATAIEYALIAGFISIMIVAGATAVGTSLDTKFDLVATGLK